MTEGKTLDRRSLLLPIASLGPLLVCAAILSQVRDFHSEPGLHSLVQLVAGFMALGCGILVMRSKLDGGGNALIVLALGLLGAGILDICHAVISIPWFRPETLAEVVPWGWLPSRVFLPLMACLSLAITWYERTHAKTGSGLLLAICAVAGIAVALTCLFFLLLPVSLPQAYFPERILSRPMELVPALLFTIALLGWLPLREWRRNNFEYNLLLALIASIIAHALFMPFSEESFDSFFAAAGFAKLVSFGFILIGLTQQAREGMKLETASERLRHRAIVELASDGIVTLDSRGAIESFNHAAEELFGYSRDELLGRNMQLLVLEDVPEAYDDILTLFEKVESITGSGQYVEATGRCKDGSRFPMEIAGSEIEIDGQTLFTAIVRDITERRQKQAELEDMSERLSLAMVAAGLGCWEAWVGENYYIWDEQMFRLFGRDPAAGPPENDEAWMETIHPEDRAGCMQIIGQAIENHADFQMEHRLSLPDDEIRWLKVQGRVLPPDATRPARIIGISRDISANKQYVKELETARTEADEANRAKSSFLATMSHEIRTPLNGVLGMTELLQKSELQHDQAEKADLIHESALSLMGIIEDVLDFSKIEAGKLEIDASETDVAGLLNSSCAMLSNLAQKQGVELELHIDPDIPGTLSGDGMRLRQIINNLVNNAIKFSASDERRGQVMVRATRVDQEDDRVSIDFVVADNGIGMDAETQQRLFNPFTQADVSTSRRFGGTGLGLAISQRLAGMMGGQIMVQSQPGEGAKFTLRLPFTRVQASAFERPDPPATHVTGQDLNGVTVPSREEAISQGTLVLVAEDNPTNREVLLHQFAALGYQADFAENGVEALALWRRGEYALLLCDLQMPEMDGYELTRSVRDAEKGRRRTPIVAFTANTLSDESERCRSAGMDDYLSKPASLEDIQELMERWLPTPVRQEENTPA